MMNISLIGNTILRAAIRRNHVSFPSQIPSFSRRQGNDTQERVVQLYFVRGWSIRNICKRYQMNKATVQKLLSEWRIRAIAAGYIQDVQPPSEAEAAALRQAGASGWIGLTAARARWFPAQPFQPDAGVSAAKRA